MVSINKSYCKELLENDSKKAVRNGINKVKQQIKDNDKEIGKLTNALKEFETDEFIVERLQNELTIKENWNKSLNYYLPKIVIHYMDL